ncbi:hypothetical protein MSAN_00304900 [Mycena sanguinolenta]|uniref:Uncharacterized protein n=1 Tax=Mycena sanguinolenta TaxID=230812 RepID=A0A8H6Z800_9AGAR|nr:hypothetical protein MSAN_00304900 [Mycena sanguinolenta]
MFREPQQGKKAKIVNISGGTGGQGGEGGANGGRGGCRRRTQSENYGEKSHKLRQKQVFQRSHCTLWYFCFRTILLGDIGLQREIGANQFTHYAGVVIRRLHSAKIRREKSNVTVAVYQGDCAEQEWQRAIEKYMKFRHPNIVQLYGIASYGNIWAAVFHDDMIPLRQFLNLYKHSHFATAYIYGYVDQEFKASCEHFITWLALILSQGVWNYLCATFQGNLVSPLVTLQWLEMNHFSCMRIAHSSYVVQLADSASISFRAAGTYFYYSYGSTKISTQQELKFLTGKNPEAIIINSLSLDQYHSICYRELSIYHYLLISPSVTIDIGSVSNYATDDTGDDTLQIAWVPNPKLPYLRWYSDSRRSFGELMADGWTRFYSDDIVNKIWLTVSMSDNRLWMRQANHIFTALQIESNLQDYGVIVTSLNITG